MRQARNHATHFKCQESCSQQQPKPDLRDLRFSRYPWQSSTISPEVIGPRSNEQLAQNKPESLFFSTHIFFLLSCIGVPRMGWLCGGHSVMCSTTMKNKTYFIHILIIYALMHTHTHTHTE